MFPMFRPHIFRIRQFYMGYISSSVRGNWSALNKTQDEPGTFYVAVHEVCELQGDPSGPWGAGITIHDWEW